MACYAYSVLTRWFSSVYSGAGSRPSSDLMAKQVVIASSVTPSEHNDSSQLPDTTYDLPEIVQPTTRKGGDTDKVIILPVETCNFIMGHAHSAFVSTRSIDDMEDSLICDGGATCTLTKSLENCTLCHRLCPVRANRGTIFPGRSFGETAHNKLNNVVEDSKDSCL